MQRLYSETWLIRTGGDHQKCLSYEKFELRSPFASAMWPPYWARVMTIGLRYVQQIIITQAGTIKLGLS